MNRARCHSLALAALLCGGGPVAADTGSSGRPPEPALVREQVAGTALQPGGRAIVATGSPFSRSIAQNRS